MDRSRREFIVRVAASAGGAMMASPFARLAAAASEGAKKRGPSPDYGPLVPARDEETGLSLLRLPRGFRYTSFGWKGDLQSDESLTPPLHDGMAAFPFEGHRVRLIRNHEVSSDRGRLEGGPAYDEAAGGGTTTLEFDTRRGKLLQSWTSVAGTLRNCAGGPTPWGSWLTCEETFAGPSSDNRFEQPHGFIFEVPVDGTATARPLRAMGRFVHEAVAVDPGTGIVYETEDAANAGFYRFLPERRDELEAGGRLQMLAVAGRPRFDTRNGQPERAEYPVEWVEIAEPQRVHHDAERRDGMGVFRQGFDAGGTVFGRLEGAWWGNGAVYLVSTSAGDARQGQVWAYEPGSAKLSLVFESPSAEVLNHPDNVCVSPRGGLVLCEDGGGAEFLHGLTPDGRIFRFAQNDIELDRERNGIRGDFRNAEFAGATFSPDGRWLFVNVQTPGITFAITGPWERGSL